MCCYANLRVKAFTRKDSVHSTLLKQPEETLAQCSHKIQNVLVQEAWLGSRTFASRKEGGRKGLSKQGRKTLSAKMESKCSKEV